MILLNSRQVITEESTAGTILLAIEDITERRVIEETLKIYAAKLERSNCELQDFAQVASHDLQEPLRKILAFGDRLKTKAGETLDQECQDYLQRMFNAAARMQNLITDLMTFSRVETMAQSFVPADLANVMIIGLDVDGNINVFNQTAEEITGYTAAEVQGSSWFEKLVPRSIPSCLG